MKYKIHYPTPLEKSENIYDDNIDVIVNTEDGDSFTFVVVTLKNLENICWMNPKGYVEPAAPFFIVEKLSHEIIESLIKELFDDPFDDYRRVYGKSLHTELKSKKVIPKNREK